MSNSSEQKIKAIVLAQNWGAGKISIGTEFKQKDSERILKLVECEGYPHGKFVFDDGEEFNIGKCFDFFFIDNTREDELSEETPVFDEETWDKVDQQLNSGDNSLIRKTLGALQVNESYHDVAYYDVTDVIERLIENKNNSGKNIDAKLLRDLYGYLINNNFPFFTKEKMYVLFYNCKLKRTKMPDISKLIRNNEEIGYLVLEGNKYIFVPKNYKLKDEYTFENNNSTGFFYTAESYLDIALSTIKKYKTQFVPVYNSELDKNNQSFGYQADASIKTLLAFSCECYLKSLLINNGKNLEGIKDLGHGLSALFTSLNDEQVGKVFNYMERNGYNVDTGKYKPTYETNDLTEKFMLDLAKVDDAFIDARYSAEKDKNTDYSFLYGFVLALRNCAKKEYMMSSPFDESISSKINNK